MSLLEETYFDENTNNPLPNQMADQMHNEQAGMINMIDGNQRGSLNAQEQTSAADGVSSGVEVTRNINYYNNNLDYNGFENNENNNNINLNAYEEEKDMNIGPDRESQSNETSQQLDLKGEDHDEEPDEEFHSFTLERDVDPDELKDPDNYYEQLSMSFYNTHKKGDNLTRKLIEQSLQMYLEAKRNGNQRIEQSERLINRNGATSEEKAGGKSAKVRVKVIGAHHNTNNFNYNTSSNIEQQQRGQMQQQYQQGHANPYQNKRSLALFASNKNSSQQDLDKNTITYNAQRSQNFDKQNETPRQVHHNQFTVTNSLKPHRYFIKDNSEGEQSNTQLPNNLTKLISTNQPLGFQLSNHQTDYTKYSSTHQKIIDMDLGFRGSLRACKMTHSSNQNHLNEEEPQQLQQHAQLKNSHVNKAQKPLITNKGINLLSHIPSKNNFKNLEAAANLNISNPEEYLYDNLSAQKVYTENNTPRNQNLLNSARTINLQQPSKFNLQNQQRNQISEQQKEFFPSIKLDDEHVRYINPNDGLQVEGKNQIKLVKQNDFFQFAAQLYRTNKSGNPQSIPNQMMKKLAINNQALNTNSLQRISNQLQQKYTSNQRLPVPYSNIKKEPISITSR